MRNPLSRARYAWALAPLLALVAVPIFLYLAGIVVPRALIGTGVDQFRGEKRELARAVYDAAHGDLFDGENVEALIVSAIKVKSARGCPGSPDEIHPGAKRAHGRPADRFQGKVRLHTFFGVPYGTAKVTCDGESGQL